MSRRILRSSLLLLAVLSGLVLLWGVSLLLAATGAPDPLQRKGRLVEVELINEYALGDARVREYRLASDTGLKVEIAIRRPARSLADRPLLLMLGGQETGRAAVDVIPDTNGVTIAAITYPFGVVPHREALGMLLAITACVAR